jgi:hypothetical protein
MSKIDSSAKETVRQARARVETYGIRVYIGDVLDPNTGTFDGSEIGIDYANDMEMSIFVLVHLFGHSVQWNTNPEYRTIDQRVRPGVGPELIEEARKYEHAASRLGMLLMHEAGIHDRDQWISDWCASDWKYISTFYATGKLPEWSDCRSTGHPMLEPLAIPRFQPARYAARYAF